MHEWLARLFAALADLQRREGASLADLDRTITAARHAHTAARRALAIAIAEEAREAERRAGLVSQLADLEQRAIAALRAGRDGLAREAAEAIAAITTEICASRRAAERFAAEVRLARGEVEAQRRRLAELDRGRRLARVGHALNATAPAARAGLDCFSEAEAALARLVAENGDARAVREEMAPPAERLIERMAEAGFGQPMQVRAGDILARLRDAAGLPATTLIESTPEAQ
ncbi:MAG: PspA/IM30 family protein [Bradyrhizobium sp.]|uniref:PspA/IM30 family protein n=1 Tax=Bradyrhizobium sp. TaxID=376 RepID=UPI001D4EB2A9|nr:PspA/IM30 family protein [Bradyrhizobium sp.]MBV9564800.1 PspA/IM30 family protein [Bradyrhizobium sp.]